MIQLSFLAFSIRDLRFVAISNSIKLGNGIQRKEKYLRFVGEDSHCSPTSQQKTNFWEQKLWVSVWMYLALWVNNKRWVVLFCSFNMSCSNIIVQHRRPMIESESIFGVTIVGWVGLCLAWWQTGSGLAWWWWQWAVWVIYWAV